MADGFDAKELDSYTKKLMNLANDTLPKQTKKHLKTEGKKLTKKNKTVYKSKGIGEITGNLKSSFKTGRVYKYDGAYSIRGYSASPHAHLIDKGWVHVSPNGSEKFVPGYNFMDEAKQAFTGEFNADTEAWLDKMLDEEGL